MVSYTYYYRGRAIDENTSSLQQQKYLMQQHKEKSKLKSEEETEITTHKRQMFQQLKLEEAMIIKSVLWKSFLVDDKARMRRSKDIKSKVGSIDDNSLSAVTACDMRSTDVVFEIGINVRNRRLRWWQWRGRCLAPRNIDLILKLLLRCR